ncbi:MAG: hypothetical protein KDK48_05700, partial [Chlamydiia bacterium]|nr:hypothetical protein [Chlamydiia bacterium]
MINAATLSQVAENKEVVATSLPEGLLQSWRFALPMHFGLGEKDHKRLPTLDLTARQSVLLCDVPNQTFKKLQEVEGARMKYNRKKRT